jgi:phospholipid/cholesterol/gamma-HCH transport system permease protein
VRTYPVNDARAMSQAPSVDQHPDTPDRLELQGEWTLERISDLQRLVRARYEGTRQIDARGISTMDSAGALLVHRLAQRLGLDPAAVELGGEHRALSDTLLDVDSTAPEPAPAARAWSDMLAKVGYSMHGLFTQGRALVGFLGLTLSTLFGVMLRPRRLRLTSTAFHMQQTGLDAVPLILLLNFLVGAVIAFLGATVLREFGAEFFVVELVGFAFMREFGVLLTAILLAGRTASAFTAQIGAMKAREEIDAIRVLGLDPIELLVIPRLLALLVMLPLLAFLAVLAGLAGGMLVGLMSLGISPEMFIARLDETIQLRHYLVGLSKAPVFALVIAVVGCLEGFKVGGTAQSVGERTTSSVVQSISLVIILDAMFAIFFMEMGW